jgi:Protein of unknown function (DUF3551)
MRRDRIQSTTTSSLRPFAGWFRMARLVRHAAAGLVVAVAAAFSPQAAQAQEYPWCLSGEGYLYCFYTTQQQCQWTASGIGGCALNPSLLFPVKPRDSYPSVISRSKL